MQTEPPGRRSKPNAVVFAADAQQLPAAVFLAARLAALNPRDDTDVILFSDSLPALRIAHHWGRAACDLRVVETNAKFSGSGHVSGATFYRFFLPRLSGAKRVLYLDADTYPESDKIWRLFDLDMDGHAVAAVRDVEVTCLNTPNTRSELQRSGRLGDRRYLNAGVMLIDVPAYTQRRLEQRFMARVLESGVHDQQAINMVLDGAWLELSPAFNTTPISYVSGLDAVVQPVISHFMGKAKPWHGALFYLKHPARAEMERYFPNTPWPQFVWSVDESRVTYNNYRPPPSFTDAALAYLAGTQFADVVQGLTPPPNLLGQAKTGGR